MKLCVCRNDHGSDLLFQIEYWLLNLVELLSGKLLKEIENKNRRKKRKLEYLSTEPSHQHGIVTKLIRCRRIISFLAGNYASKDYVFLR